MYIRTRNVDWGGVLSLHNAVSYRKMPEVTAEVPRTPGKYTGGEAQPLKGHVHGTWLIGASTQ
jgi:hypothetical protein